MQSMRQQVPVNNWYIFIHIHYNCGKIHFIAKYVSVQWNFVNNFCLTELDYLRSPSHGRYNLLSYRLLDTPFFFNPVKGVRPSACFIKTDKRIQAPFNTVCNRRNGPNFGRVFLMLNYTDITQNTYVPS